MTDIMRVPFVRATRNGHGQETIVRGLPYPVAGAAFWPEQSVETRDGGHRVVRPAQLAVPHSEVTDPRDQWLINGDRYSAAGDTGRWENPFTGWRPGGTLALERVTG